MKHEPTVTDIIVDVPFAVNKKPSVNTQYVISVFVSECVNVHGYSLHNNMAGRNITNCKKTQDTQMLDRCDTGAEIREPVDVLNNEQQILTLALLIPTD